MNACYNGIERNFMRKSSSLPRLMEITRKCVPFTGGGGQVFVAIPEPSGRTLPIHSPAFRNWFVYRALAQLRHHPHPQRLPRHPQRPRSPGQREPRRPAPRRLSPRRVPLRRLHPHPDPPRPLQFRLPVRRNLPHRLEDHLRHPSPLPNLPLHRPPPQSRPRPRPSPRQPPLPRPPAPRPGPGPGPRPPCPDPSPQPPPPGPRPLAPGPCLKRPPLPPQPPLPRRLAPRPRLAPVRPPPLRTLSLPHPSGPPGSGKTFAARILRTLLDPSSAPLSPIPATVRDLHALARHNWILAFDHVSTLSPPLTDALCRLSSGLGSAVNETSRPTPGPSCSTTSAP